MTESTTTTTTTTTTPKTQTEYDLEKLYENIQDARRVLKGITHQTKCLKSASFSNMTGANIFLKSECTQKTGAFKVRGASYAISKLDKSSCPDGVVAVSAGNHAQGVAYGSSRMGIKSVVVMPECTPFDKRSATKDYGAEVVVKGETFDEAFAYAEKEYFHRMKLIHPFADLDVIAGQGTVGLEILERVDGLDIVFVPCGGGGLITGIAAAIKKTHPHVKVIGVEAAGANKMQESMKAGHLVTLPGLDTICDGISLKRAAETTFDLCQMLVDEIVSVTDDEVCRAIYYLLQRCKLVAEPAGAVAVAAALAGRYNIKGKTVCCVVSGGNIDMSMLARIVTQQLLCLHVKYELDAVVLDKTETLSRIMGQIHKVSTVKLLSISHDRTSPGIAPNKARVSLEVEVPSPDDLALLLDNLKKEGFNFDFKRRE